MIYRPELLDVLQAAASSRWSAQVYRHMFGSYPPTRPNVGGARWNPPGLEAIYASCERETALAEAEYYIRIQPTRPRATRILYTLEISLDSIVDLRSPELLASVGITDIVLRGTLFERCQHIGSAARWLGHHGLLVPSARREGGINLVILEPDPARVTLKIIDDETVNLDDRR